jgi:hypothetical protein
MDATFTSESREAMTKELPSGSSDRDFSRYPGATPSKNKNGLPRGKPLSYLVAGTGFEPVTFGL